MEQNELKYIIEAVLFAAGEPVPTERICAACECDADEVDKAAQMLMDELSFDRRGIRVIRLENAYQMCSAGEMSPYITKALETRKPPKLSASQLETLTIVAYYQPATKAYVEQLRGVDCSYSIGALLTKKLIEECGRLNVPGRPILYKTTPDFLRTFGLASIDELPEIEKINFGKPEQLELAAMEELEKQNAEAQAAPPAEAQQETLL
ncbi:MAG: SMC-Scp complex subunit ScpB [Clostridia bacterium]|nr:SMC-Scp complex subunit ScpB [Clostridia bacterium]